ncbi:hypothetical protein FRB97_007396 [Tulasnella sp. 331]|nr:hypothetical protein FRB97_007396 [Tulasnella sp. 331]KAG8880554.1 hypothetical protein FRB98_005010 [Tulasnella sp. 332]
MTALDIFLPKLLTKSLWKTPQRHWHDSEPNNQDVGEDSLDRPLVRGEIGVSYLASGELEIVEEQEFHLVDRALQQGDIVKRNVHDLQSGVVLDTKVEIKVEHAVSQIEYGTWVSSEEFEPSTDIFLGDYVVYDDWVGQVHEIFEEAVFELSTGELFRFAEIGGRFQVGDRGADMLPSDTAEHLRHTTSANISVLAAVRPTVLAISWLAINQSLLPEVSATKQRPQRFWTADEVLQLCLVRPISRLRVSDRVRFKNASVAAMHGVKTTRHGKSTVSPGVVEVDTLIVRETRTVARVLWQDGTITEDIPARELLPYTNPDEYDCWPGDYVLWKGEDDMRAGIVQHVNAYDRTAQLYWKVLPSRPESFITPPSYTLVSVMELDPHGTSTPSDDQPECVGVRRGEFVLIHREGTTNGSTVPRVPKIGEMEPWSKENNPHGWRFDMAHAGMDYAQRHSEKWQNDGLGIQNHAAADDNEEETRMPGAFGVEHGEVETRLRWRDPSDLEWFGEVTNLRTSGDVEVTLPSGATIVVPLDRLTLLVDGREAFMPQAWAPGEGNEPVTLDASLPPGGSPTYNINGQLIPGASLQTLGQYFHNGGADPLHEPSSGLHFDPFAPPVLQQHLSGPDHYGNTRPPYVASYDPNGPEPMDIYEAEDERWETDHGGDSAADEADVEMDIVIDGEESEDVPMQVQARNGEGPSFDILDLDSLRIAATGTDGIAQIINSVGGPEAVLRSRADRGLSSGPLTLTDLLSLRNQQYSPSTTLAQGSLSTSPEKPMLQTPTPPKSDSEESGSRAGSAAAEDGRWKRFDVLSSAPADHAFLDKRKGSAGQQSRLFMARLSKEYKMLNSSLPDTIIVRAYEDRTDLLRSMIIGPENTPYEGAPFMIDWFLDETFPQTPPIAHFHSWTNGNGRVNPNLYEEGKVCLSILGTWAGDKNESWSPLRSSLMQALVSIQGLVLVKEPWFCEPAYEKLRGTPEGIVNSRLYSEKAYVLSCGFVRRALEAPPIGLGEEIEWLYITQGRLAKVIQEARSLIEAAGAAPSGSSSADSGEPSTIEEEPVLAWDGKAIPRLSAGAVLMLQRTLLKLEAIQTARQTHFAS